MLKAIIKLGRMIISVDSYSRMGCVTGTALIVGESKISVLGSNSSWASMFTFVKNTRGKL